MTVGEQGNFGTIGVLECFSWGAVEINTRTRGDKLWVNFGEISLKKKFPIAHPFVLHDPHNETS